MAQIVKNPPAIQETQVQSLGQEDPLEKGMATTPVFLPGEFHGLVISFRSLAGYSPWGCKESDRTEQLMQTLLCIKYCSKSFMHIHQFNSTIILWEGTFLTLSTDKNSVLARVTQRYIKVLSFEPMPVGSDFVLLITIVPQKDDTNKQINSTAFRVRHTWIPVFAD